VGEGVPLVLIPGVQGRWEWMGEAVDTLSQHFRVLTFTLAGEPTSSHPFDARLGFDSFTAQLDRLLDEARVSQAVICGVSYGGLIGLRYAALQPSRVRALALVSAPPPDYEPDGRVEKYLRAPRLMAPLFCAGAISRGWAEMRRALPTWRARAAFASRQAKQVARAPMRPRLMRDRVRLLRHVNLVEAATLCRVPVLVITGDPDLDRVVTVASTLRYRELLPHVTVVRIERTGHLGLVLRPDVFAQHLADFVADLDPNRITRCARTG
jgi:pimeloyl-ACP methyl ester carboxylesterase